MSSLAQTYSQATGLKIGKPHISKKFFPLSEEKYITIQPFSKNQSAKCYDYWNEVLVLLGPILAQNKVKIYQIGEKDEPALAGVSHLMGQTSIPQAHFIIQNSLLHLGADSFISHSAGAMNVPQVTLFGNTSPIHHGPHWRGNAILLESHRNNCSPSFSQEQNKTINLITPEEVVNAALKLLGATGQVNRKSLCFGSGYNSPALEWVPNFKIDNNLANGSVLVARFDYHAEEAYLFDALQFRKLSIITKSEFNIEILAKLKENVIGITIDIERDSKVSVEFIKALKSIGIKIQFITFESDAEWVSAKRLELFDHAQIHKVTRNTKDNLLSNVENYTNDKSCTDLIKNDKSLWFRSSKFTLSNNKIYLSHFHYINDIPTKSFENNVMNFIDDPLFYYDLDHFYIFNQNV